MSGTQPESFNLYTHFQQQISARASDELLSTETNQRYTWSDVDQRSAQIARFLTDLGARPGDRVSVQVEKSPQALCLYLACLRAGLVFHPLNMGYKAAELEYFLSNAEPTVIVCDSRDREPMGRLADAAGAKHLLTLDADGSGTLADESSTAATSFDTLHRDRNDLAALLYSSGTTGVPKGIMLTHNNLLASTQTLVDAWGFTDKDRLLHALPIFHVHGLFVAVGCVMLSGASMRWLQAYDAQQVIEFLPECTVLMGVPTYYRRLLNEPSFGSDVTKGMRLFISGSAPLLADTFREFEARTGLCILERYGMTETNMNTSNPLHGTRKAGTVGPPLPGVEVRVCNDEGGVVPTGEIGNLQVRGPNVFAGYWRMPDKTAEDFTDDGFFNTGDNASIDDDGYVSLVGRSKDLVITGGLNVYSKEIELFIDDLPGVRESAVIGVPHDDFGEAVVAVVVRQADSEIDEATIIATTKEQLANFKVPKRVVFVDELPRNTMAKVQKNVLRDAHSGLFDTRGGSSREE